MKFVLWGRYCADALTKRLPYREQHLAGLKEQRRCGLLLTLGPTAGSIHKPWEKDVSLWFYPTPPQPSSLGY